MKKKLFKNLSLLAVLCTALLSSCGNSSSSSDVITIHFWHTFGQDIQQSMNAKIESFKELVLKNEGVKVDVVLDYQGAYDDIKTKVLRGFSSGNTPTIAVAYPDHVAEYLSSESKDGEYVVNLDTLMKDSELGFTKDDYLNPSGLGSDDFIPSFLEEGQSYLKSGTYSLPLMKSTEVMFYDQANVFKLLSDYDSSITNKEEYMNSLTWDKFMDILKFAKKNLANYGTNLEVPLIYDSDANLYITDCYQNKIDYLSVKDGKGSCDFNNSASKAMVSKLKSNFDEGLFLTKGTNNNEYGSNKFTASACLFSIGSSGGAGYNDPGAASFKVGVAKVPSFNKENDYFVSQGPTLTLLNSSGVDSATNASRVKYGWKFIKYITNTENSASLCLDSNGYIPVRASSFTDSEYASYLALDDFLPRCASVVYNKINGKYLNYPVFKGSATARDEVGGVLTQVFLDKKTVDQAFEDAYNHTLIAMN